ncbi:MAG: alpha/beta hydrolase, partial [Planctomycetes bacterium]|nr:alpha/beta hydrolase [Planctomycetota bacterium]
APDAAPRAAAVMCHPHPLFGGTMRTNALFRAARGLQHAGIAVLRFNFRGVERSEGVHHGQGGEVDDLGAALDWMGERFPGLELWAGGFSFGARTSAERATKDPRIAKVVLVAVPVLRFDCGFLRELHRPGLVLMAGNDEFGNLAQLRERYPELDPRIELDEIPNVGHFFEGQTQAVAARVQHWAERQLETRA